MSAFTRILQLPATRRSYSSFFSSKSGGGRYFNSAKPPKTPVVPGKSAPKSDSASEAAPQDGAQASDPQNSLRPGNVTAESQSSSAPSSSSPASSAPNADNSVPHHHNSFAHLIHHPLQPHPMINEKEFKLHQFFSLHRPLLLLSNPPSILESPPANVSLFSSVAEQKQQQQQQNKQQASPFEEALDSSVDADAEAARQLTRAYTINKAGATMAWEDTLRRLGVDVTQDADRIGLQEQWNREWQEVMLDSTKRKRRKKMRKHKLKKRRKATRASRLRGS
ncbi:hypothetical protein BDQ12DRAFT_676013 [Crucibulum laeve]|uniref:Small ribosomal subunit protein mS38 n=1 Tax=Crucibulum laeve TaxID=68775 RepID=A0A5C3MC55_9AGAR|nr:hypothetical protein BDQ12DRAFT_676013 [Crucibulum laeve]